jgi:mannose/fructose/N-acetylgalactosamine-specific phosphotransferase system component IIC
MEVLFFCLVGGLLATDTEAFGQTMISQPFVACAIAGILFGDFVLGCTIGIVFQLLFMIEIPVGGVRLFLTNIGAYVAAGVSISFKKSLLISLDPGSNESLYLLIAVLYGTLLGWLGRPIRDFSRKLNLYVLQMAEKNIENGNATSVGLWNFLGVINAFLMGVVIVGLGYAVANTILNLFSDFSPTALIELTRYFLPGLFGTLAGILLFFFRRQGKFTLWGSLVGFVVLASILLNR